MGFRRLWMGPAYPHSHIRLLSLKEEESDLHDAEIASTEEDPELSTYYHSIDFGVCEKFGSAQPIWSQIRMPITTSSEAISKNGGWLTSDLQRAFSWGYIALVHPSWELLGSSCAMYHVIYCLTHIPCLLEVKHGTAARQAARGRVNWMETNQPRKATLKCSVLNYSIGQASRC